MTYNDELYHYGVLGMKWGKRRYTNPDGSLTALGKKRRSLEASKNKFKSARDEYNSAAYENDLLKRGGMRSVKSDTRLGDAARNYTDARSEYKQEKREFKDLKRQTAAELKGSKTVSKGRATAGKILAFAGGTAVAATAVTAAGIVAAGKVLDSGFNVLDNVATIPRAMRS